MASAYPLVSGCGASAGAVGPLPVSCNRGRQHNLAPKERHNLVHGVKPWVEGPSLSFFPSPARPAAQSAVPIGLRAQGLRATGRRERGVPQSGTG